MEKKGDIQISFGMIFSIILIIALVGVSFYVIMHFLDLRECTSTGLFYQDIENRIASAWSAVEVQEVYKGRLPGGIDEVCFGNSSTIPLPGYEDEFAMFKKYYELDENVFLYPPGKVCTGLEKHKLEHITTSEFFCVNVIEGKMQVKMSKTSSDSFVKLSK